jgi:hypothetical protein
MLSKVDGLVGLKTPKLATWETRTAGNRSIHPNQPMEQTELRFLEYRLEVAKSWPDSPRKEATIGAILLRLNGNAPSAVTGEFA